uniref:X-box-binding protein 1 n=1 Tax=Euleptes europaea TaxID=460621 RepID=UPI0025425C71|nr:X-box-binding protein 1 [Euleptes europaea]
MTPPGATAPSANRRPAPPPRHLAPANPRRPRRLGGEARPPGPQSAQRRPSERHAEEERRGGRGAGTEQQTAAMPPLPGPAAAPQQPRLLPLPAAAAPPSPPPRKRQRLAHLSAEEKALRRKLKNRVAAQSARDRKKARMGDLERQAVELEAQNQKLLAENRALRERTLSLALENRTLRLRLGLPATEVAPPPQAEALEDVAEEEEVAPCQVEVAGTGPAVVAPLGCLRLDADSSPGSESDLLLGFLDSLDPDMFLPFGGPEPASLEQVQQQEEDGGETDPLSPSPSSSLGASSPKLEAINELIRFDHEYTKPFILQIAADEVSRAGIVGRVERVASFSSENVLLGPSLSLKEEPIDILLPKLGISHLLSPDEKPLMDASSDSGYEGSLSPFSDLSSPLGADYVWDETFANELFPQLISV